MWMRLWMYGFFHFITASAHYEKLGCWKDAADRAVATLEGLTTLLDGPYKNRADAIKKCYEVSKQRGFAIFAIQDGGWCAANNGESYKKYGSSNDCKEDGKGGPWANQVYKITENLPFNHVGCWKDSADRAIATLEGLVTILDGFYKNRAEAIEKCYTAAKQLNFEYFAVQDGGWCAAGNGVAYKKYGDSCDCKGDGKGGPWANDVYKIKPTSLFQNLGCWKDTADRAVATLEGSVALLDGSDYTNRADAIKKCYEAAKLRGFTVFAVQNGGWCAAGNGESYKKYGASNDCKGDGKGGPWANQVYKIAEKLPYNYAGCWKDTADRAVATLEGLVAILDGPYKNRADAIKKCYTAAKQRNFAYFAVQDGGWCAAGSGIAYKKYGSSGDCRADGKGGPWANDVYIIKDALPFGNLGCWKDTADRAVATLEGSVALLDGSDYTNRADAIKKCYEAAKLRGFTVFAVQNGGWCAAGNGESYKKYGASNDCKGDGKGGPWANQVYKIAEKLPYNYAGCWKDTADRAVATLEGLVAILDGPYKNRADAIKKCYTAAKQRNFAYFAVQDGGWCAAGSGIAYKKYGSSGDCRADGKGGPWANDVYIIKDALPFGNLGCWKDTADRAVATLEGSVALLDGSDYTNRADAIKKCYEAAKLRGFTVFAVQNGGWCAAGNGESYKKYGASNDCKGDGKGGPWANQVYKIAEKLPYNYAGCWKDTADRAVATLEGLVAILDGPYKNRADAIKKCYTAAKQRNFAYFAVQDGGWCAAGSGIAYKKYGSSGDCRADGKGGPWANDVYIIKDALPFGNLGCWKDTADRAVATLEGSVALLDGSDYTNRADAIKKCYEAAKLRGFTVFAVQNGGWCAAGNGESYKKYGASNDCKGDGKGGPWANQVYKIAEKLPYNYAGCWKDTADRAVATLEGLVAILDGPYKNRADAIKKCYTAAKQRNFAYFAVQDGGWCAAGSGIAYKKYGSSGDCRADGKGGPWANDVYIIKDALPFGNLGCWKDTADRAVATLEGSVALLDGLDYTNRADAIKKCYEAAKLRGFTVFAVQNGGWCAAGNGESYKKYGASNDCKGDGKGGPWANQVYKIAEKLPYKNLGCWKDTADRAVATLEGSVALLDGSDYTNRADAIKKCYEAAKLRGFTVFAVQNGGWCAAGNGESYKKYGASNDCKGDGKGGPWANQVYKIAEKLPYNYAGCWKDTADRAVATLEGLVAILDGPYKNRADAIKKCYTAAKQRNFAYFAVQDGGWCAAGSGIAYKKYGSSGDCRADGKGGPWANDVYIIKDALPFGNLGCWKDTADRAVATLEGSVALLDGSDYTNRADAIKKCYEAAKLRGFTVFAVQNGGWCAAGNGESYKKYGASNDCKGDGKGGPWANQVYKIAEKLPYNYAGCWKDTADRAVATLEGLVAILDGPYKNRADAIKKCYTAAKQRNFAYFAVQDGGWCAAGSGIAYKKYGSSGDCRADGKGGPWANDVYIIKDALPFGNLGCWKDTADRAVATLEGSVALLDGSDYTNRADAIKKCYEAAKLRGFTVFAVQNGGWCAAGNGESYKKYGASNDCKGDGKGGPWANQVYKIAEKLPYNYAGCWKDTADRAVATLEGLVAILDGPYKNRADAIKKCYTAAKQRNFAYFAVQDGGWCAAGSGIAYKKYGSSGDCRADGKGGPWANDIYVINCI
ncbi:uncharacterized protein LOC100207237 isoform X3 [Hydra vulgaris]|uniref:uncharacterized protein LOC100207237 isoform X3 n=1 Tax=Hydra vulgaris TaxID=6087 RepID=UPI001F5F2148|nr:uncharacterized protein LOC100207237 isoform X3 [Hydra vulgaris]